MDVISVHFGEGRHATTVPVTRISVVFNVLDAKSLALADAPTAIDLSQYMSGQCDISADACALVTDVLADNEISAETFDAFYRCRSDDKDGVKQDIICLLRLAHKLNAPRLQQQLLQLVDALFGVKPSDDDKRNEVIGDIVDIIHGVELTPVTAQLLDTVRLRNRRGEGVLHEYVLATMIAEEPVLFLLYNWDYTDTSFNFMHVILNKDHILKLGQPQGDGEDDGDDISALHARIRKCADAVGLTDGMDGDFTALSISNDGPFCWAPIGKYPDESCLPSSEDLEVEEDGERVWRVEDEYGTALDMARCVADELKNVALICNMLGNVLFASEDGLYACKYVDAVTEVTVGG